MDLNILIYLVLGTALFGMTFLPRMLKRHPLTVPLVYVVGGFLLFKFSGDLKPLEIVSDSEDRSFLEYFTELLVIVSLAGAGLKIDKKFSWRGWSVGWRLLGITMPLTILGVALIGYWGLALAPATAILLGACLAPTDPVLAEDVQVGAPHEGKESSVRFGLTLEAGLNDALAFPFVYLAIAAVGKASLGNWLTDWFLMDVLWRCAIGMLGGYAVGRALSYYLNHHSQIAKETEEQKLEGTEGLFVVAAILLVYSLTEICEGYGFLAVFVAALVGKSRTEEKHNKSLYRFVSQFERLLLVGMLIGFGGMLHRDVAYLSDWRVWAFASCIVFALRPAAGMLSMLGSGICRKRQLALSFYGIRGIGSIYYLAYGLRKADFAGGEKVWSVIAATIILSLLVHGVTASKTIARLDPHQSPSVN